MAIEVIGAGFGRTGTLSLKHALEQLGFGRCYHMMEILDYRNTPPSGAPQTAVKRLTGMRSSRAIDQP